MAQLLVRDLDIETINRLKERAKLYHRSLQGEAKLILEEAAKRMTMEEARGVAEKWQKKLKGRVFSNSVELIREDRGR